MHVRRSVQALLVLFKSALSPERVDELFRARADRYLAVPGLLQKFYIRDPQTGQAGGFYVFDSAASLEAFSQSDLARSIGDAYRPTEAGQRRQLDIVLALRPPPDGRGHEALVRRVIDDGYNAGKLDALDALFAPSYVDHQEGIAPANLEGVKGFIRAAREAFPDLALVIEEVMAAGDRLWTRTTARGTHRGTFIGLPPTGKAFEVTRFDAYRIEAGKIAEHWGVIDRLKLVHQLGATLRPR